MLGSVQWPRTCWSTALGHHQPLRRRAGRRSLDRHLDRRSRSDRLRRRRRRRQTWVPRVRCDALQFRSSGPKLATLIALIRSSSRRTQSRCSAGSRGCSGTAVSQQGHRKTSAPRTTTATHSVPPSSIPRNSCGAGHMSLARSSSSARRSTGAGAPANARRASSGVRAGRSSPIRSAKLQTLRLGRTCQL